MPQPQLVPSARLPGTPSEWEETLAYLFGSRLTARERQVCARRCLGYADSEIASELFVAKGTVKTYDLALLLKFDLRSVRQLPAHCFAQLWQCAPFSQKQTDKDRARYQPFAERTE